MKHNSISRSLPSCVPSSQESTFVDLSEEYDFLGDTTETDNQVIHPVQNKVTLFLHLYCFLQSYVLYETFHVSTNT